MQITLKAARVNAGYTQLDIAKRLKISKNTLVSYEKYRTIPDALIAKEMASIYGVSVNDLIFLPSDCALSPISTNQT